MLVVTLTVLGGCANSVQHEDPPIVAEQGTAQIALLLRTGQTRELASGSLLQRFFPFAQLDVDGPEWSPDHLRVLFRLTDYSQQPRPGTSLWAIGSSGQGLWRILTIQPPDQVRYATWGAGGSLIAYDDNDGIWVMNRDGTDRRELARRPEFLFLTDLLSGFGSDMHSAHAA